MNLRSVSPGGFRLVLLMVMAAAVAGCASYNDQIKAAKTRYDAGDVNGAAQTVSDLENNVEPRDKLIFLLEDGALQRAAGHLDLSEKAFDGADQLTTQFDQQAKTSVSQTTASIVLEPAVADYHGYAYDRIMTNTYKALDAMELGDLDRARVELTRAYEREQDAVAAHKQQIADAQKAAQDKNANSGFNENAAESDPNFKSSFNQQYADLKVQDLSGYTDYVNPFTEYLRGIYLMTNGADASDLEQGATVLRRVAGLVKGNTYVAQDAVLAEQVASGKAVPPATYVIFETGAAPSRDEVLIGFPVITSTGVKYVKAAFPKLVMHPCATPNLTVVSSDGTNYPTAQVCSMDKVVVAEFENDLPIVITQALISAAVKAIAEVVAQEAAKNNETVSVLTQVVSVVAVEISTHADLRAWQSLPNAFCVAKLPTPTDRNITLTFPNGKAAVPVHVADGTVNFVYVKMADSWNTPIVRQFKLK